MLGTYSVTEIFGASSPGQPVKKDVIRDLKIMCCCLYYFCDIHVIFACDMYLGWFTSARRSGTLDLHSNLGKLSLAKPSHERGKPVKASLAKSAVEEALSYKQYGDFSLKKNKANMTLCGKWYRSLTNIADQSMNLINQIRNEALAPKWALWGADLRKKNLM